MAAVKKPFSRTKLFYDFTMGTVLEHNEMIDEEIYLKLSSNRQHEIISEYCSDVQKLIELSNSKAEAEKILSEQCAKFIQHCSSRIIFTAVTMQIQKIIDNRWKS